MEKYSPDEIRNKVVASYDRQQFEGPLGESFLPGASVGYSRIVTKSILSGPTTPGFTISEFFTTRDHPQASERFSRVSTLDFRNGDPQQMSFVLYSFMKDYVFNTQGYSFVLTDMNGKAKSVATYGGSYNKPESWFLSSRSDFQYADPLSNVAMLKSYEFVHDVSSSDAYMGYPGRETELFFESRDIVDESHIANVQADLKFGTTPSVPPLWELKPSLFASYSHNDSRYRSHVTTKITRAPALLVGVRKYADGITDTLDYTKFYSESGAPVATRDYDEHNAYVLPHRNSSVSHNGWYDSYQIPAATKYTGMGKKCLPGESIKHLDYVRPSMANNHSIISIPTDYVSSTAVGSYQSQELVPRGLGPTIEPAEINQFLCKKYAAFRRLDLGDVVEVSVTSADANGNEVTTVLGVFHVVGRSLTADTLAPTSENPSPDFYNSPLSVDVRVIESGKTNQLTQTCAQIVQYGAAQLEGTVSDILGSVKSSVVAGLNGTSHECSPFLSSKVSRTHDCETEGERIVRLIQDASKNVTILQLIKSTDNFLNTTLVTEEYFPTPIFNKIALSPRGQLAFEDICGNKHELTKLRFCIDGEQVVLLDNVISATAHSYGERHSIADEVDPFGRIPILPIVNDYELGKRGKWHPIANYIYRSSTTSNTYSSPHTDNTLLHGQGLARNYNSGMVNHVPMFNFKVIPQNYVHTDVDMTNGDQARMWVRSDSVTLYNSDGAPVEQENILSNRSSLRYRDKYMFPAISVKNASYGSVAFFNYDNSRTSNPTTTVRTGHTGRYYSGSYSTAVLPFIMSKEHIRSGTIVRLWARDPWNSQELNTSSMRLSLFTEAYPDLVQKSATQPRLITKSGGWNMYEFTLTALEIANMPDIIEGTKCKIKLEYLNANNAAAEVPYDDIVVQPAEADVDVTIFDYQKSRVLARLDANHLASYCQYTDEGKNVRIRTETVRGVKTVSEVEANVPVVAKVSEPSIPNQLVRPPKSNSIAAVEPNSYSVPRTMVSRDVNGKQNLASITLAPDKKEINVFGHDDNSFSQLKELLSYVGNLGKDSTSMIRLSNASRLDSVVATVNNESLQQLLEVEKVTKESVETAIRRTSSAMLSLEEGIASYEELQPNAASSDSKLACQSKVHDLNEQLHDLRKYKSALEKILQRAQFAK